MTRTALYRHYDADTLPALIDKATAALECARSSAEVLEARDLARVAYDAAKSAGRMARAKQAHDSIVSEVHRAQAHALSIRARAEMRLAEEYDAAQERGEVARGTEGRGLGVARDNAQIATAADLGLRRDEIHEARQFLKAEQAEPGVIERTVAEIVERGEEPTRAALRREVMEAARSVQRAPSNKNPLHRPDASRDAVIRFTGDCRRVAEADDLEGLAKFDGYDGFRRQMIDQAKAASRALAQFLEMAGESNA